MLLPKELTPQAVALESALRDLVVPYSLSVVETYARNCVFPPLAIGFATQILIDAIDGLPLSAETDEQRKLYTQVQRAAIPLVRAVHQALAGSEEMINRAIEEQDISQDQEE